MVIVWGQCTLPKSRHLVLVEDKDQSALKEQLDS